MLYLKRHASHHISSIFCIHPRIDYYDGRDATEVMHAFHSAKGGGSMRPCGHGGFLLGDPVGWNDLQDERWWSVCLAQRIPMSWRWGESHFWGCATTKNIHLSMLYVLRTWYGYSDTIFLPIFKYRFPLFASDTRPSARLWRLWPEAFESSGDSVSWETCHDGRTRMQRWMQPDIRWPSEWSARKKLEDEGWWQRDLALEARVMLWDSFCLSDPFSSEPFLFLCLFSFLFMTVMVVALMVVLAFLQQIDDLGQTWQARQWLIWALVTGLGVACARSGGWPSVAGVVLLALANTQARSALRPGHGCTEGKWSESKKWW